MDTTAIEAATAAQPAAEAALRAALRAGPGHAYLFAGPRGTGKAATARAFAAELLAVGAADPVDSRRRALAVPSPHPDLTWLTPPGNQHLVEEIRERVISAADYRPFEAGCRIFVIEAAEAMAEESQNALLKTLEEPKRFAHFLLLAAEPQLLLETVRSRCQPVRFAALGAVEIEARLRSEGFELGFGELTALARLCGGDLERARFLATAPGRELRAAAEACARASCSGELGDSPWLGLLEIAKSAGETAGRQAEDAIRARAEESGDPRLAARIERDALDFAKRTTRKRRTELLDLGLALITSWLRDTIAHAEGAPHLALNSDRSVELAAGVARFPLPRGTAAIGLVERTRRALRVNVGEELALEALCLRLARGLATVR